MTRPLHHIPERYRFTTFLTPVNYSPKTDKGIAYGYHTGILYLAPARQSGYNVCADASPDCTKVCLNLAGRGGLGIDLSVLAGDGDNTNPIQKARNARTRFFFERRADFNARIVHDIGLIRKQAADKNRKPAMRPNGTSDLPWERLPVRGDETIFECFPDVQFYDYTKSAKRAIAHARGEMPANYHLTFSRSEVNDAECMQVLAAGGNVAIVFDVPTKKPGRPAGPLPEFWRGYRVIDGDKHDLRFLDPAGVVVGLRAKGPAAGTGSATGFVADLSETSLAPAA